MAAENRAALVTFISCGDPNMDYTAKLVKTVCESGADIVELGTPFSDPMADGPVIQAASQRALGNGANVMSILDMVAKLRADGIKNPFVLFSYFNPIFKTGIEKVAKRSKEVGVDAWLVVDVPLEESAEITSHINKLGIDFVPLAAPTSPVERVAEISKCGSGMLYYVTVTGVTGVRNALPKSFAERLAAVRKASSLPVAAGFGISNPTMAHLAAESADAVVVGSKIVTLSYETYLKDGEDAAIKAVSEFVKTLAAQMKR